MTDKREEYWIGRPPGATNSEVDRLVALHDAMRAQANNTNQPPSDEVLRLLELAKKQRGR